MCGLVGNYTRVAAGGGKVFMSNSAGMLYESDAALSRLATTFELDSDTAYTDLAYDATLDLVYLAVNHHTALSDTYGLLQLYDLADDAYALSRLPVLGSDPILSVAAAGGVVAWAGGDGLWLTESAYFQSYSGPAHPQLQHLANFGLTATDISLMRSDGAGPPPAPLPAPGGPGLVLLLAAVALLASRCRVRP